MFWPVCCGHHRDTWVCKCKANAVANTVVAIHLQDLTYSTRNTNYYFIKTTGHT